MKTILTLLIAVSATCANAQFKSGNDLRSDHISSNSIDRGVSLGFVMGVADAGNGILFCLPRNVTAGQVQDMAMSTINNHPEIRHLRANEIIEYTLRRSWPCEKKGGGV